MGSTRLQHPRKSCSVCFSSSFPSSPLLSDFWPLALLFCLWVFLMQLKPQSPLLPRLALCALSISHPMVLVLGENPVHLFGNWRNKQQIVQPIQLYICRLSVGSSFGQRGEMKTLLARRLRTELGSYLTAFLKFRKEQLSLRRAFLPLLWFPFHCFLLLYFLFPSIFFAFILLFIYCVRFLVFRLML